MDTRQFVAEHKITANVEPRDANPNMASQNWDANHWLVTLKLGRRQFSVPFSTGLALNEPNASDVLDCLASDASTEYYTTTFEEWADELGFDADSRTAYRSWQTTHRQTNRLKQFLGDELFNALLCDTDRL